MIALQGHAGALSDCRVCHGVVPAGPGPHGMLPTAVVETELLGGADRLAVWPSPLAAGAGCTIRLSAARAGTAGRLLVFDARGRTIRLLEVRPDKAGEAIASWDGRDARGRQAAAGVYFLRWSDGSRYAAAKVVMVD